MQTLRQSDTQLSACVDLWETKALRHSDAQHSALGEITENADSQKLRLLTLSTWRHWENAET